MYSDSNTVISLKQKKICMAVYITSIICMYLTTARFVILPTILTEIKGMQYYSVVVTLTATIIAISTPIIGKLGDLFGRKKLFLIGITGYGIASLLAGISYNVYIFMISIVLIGLFSGMLYSMQLPIIVNIIPELEQPKFISYIYAFNSLGSLLGPICGGFLTDNISWRWVYFSVIPMAVVAFVIILKHYKETSVIFNDKPIDYKGMITFIFFILPLMYVLTIGKEINGWNSLSSILLLIISFISLLFLIKIEKKVEDPLIPFTLFQKSSYINALFITFISAMTFSVANYLPLYYQGIRGLTATSSGMISMPRQVTQIVFALIVGRIVVNHNKMRDLKKITITIFLLYLSSLSIFGRFGVQTSIYLIVFTEILFGIPNGSYTVVSSVLAGNSLDSENTGVGFSFISFCSSLSASIGSVIAGAIINQFWSIEQLVPLSIRNVLSTDNLFELHSVNILNNASKLSEMKHTIPKELYSLFDETIYFLGQALNSGLSSMFYFFSIIILFGLIVVSIRNWDKT